MDRWKFWLKAINQLDLTKRKPWTPSKLDVLCSDHFSAEEFTLLRHTKLKILKDMAVSSILSWKIQHQVVVLLILCYNSCNGMTFISSCSVSLKIPRPECSTITAITAEDFYTCEPDKLKRKYQETLNKLDHTQKELLSAKRREKSQGLYRKRVARARGTAKNILRRLSKCLKHRKVWFSGLQMMCLVSN
ncbi:hypothetical protein LSH36_269g06049 [Paralvinella palmiformis]|uniref:THAP-type domain-containing protein n=1 Tax=Paralvinella palmiformis TaxID=53620 RepID=A0AAD9JJM3_9ANNE|nr:hypothetical protein LSH36_269g06049 [Paralvinella palmiformis]